MQSLSPELLFGPIVHETKCPFAIKSLVHYGTVWEEGVLLSSAITTWCAELAHFTETAREAKLDGFVLSGVGSQVPATLPALAAFVKQVTFGLAQLGNGVALSPSEICVPGWQFTFQGMRLFIITFAALYPKESPRRSPVPQSVSMFLQPELSFDHHMIYPELDPRNLHLKDIIRERFREANMGYDIGIVESNLEALKYVKPLTLGDPPVEWWNP